MASDEHEQTDEGHPLRKLGIPVAVCVVGAAIGIAMAQGPKKRLRRAVSDLKDVDVGDLTGDLRGKLDSMRGQRDGQGARSRRLGSEELQKRLQERAERRAQRRKPAPTT